MSRAELIAKYPGAPVAFIDVFLASGYSMRHFYPMRIAWQKAMDRATQVCDENGRGVELVKFVLRKES